jgi:hypothetical protein
MLGKDLFLNSIHFAANHAAIFGRTRTGKSTLAEHIASTAIETGFFMLDPAGGMTHRMAGIIPHHRTNDTLYINPLENRVPSITFFDGDTTENIVEDTVRLIKNLYPDAWGPRTDFLAANLIAAEVATNPGTLLDIQRALVEKDYRRELAMEADPYLTQFFKILESIPPAMRVDVVLPLYNKISRLMGNPHVRHIFAQRTPTFSFREAMDRGQIILAELPRGKLGEATNFIGSTLITKLNQAAMSREKTNPYLAIIDEAHTFTAGIQLPIALAEVKKYGLSYVLITQNINLISENDRAAIFANAGIVACYRTSHQDAKIIAAEMGTDLQPRAFQELPNHRCIYRADTGDIPASPTIVKVNPPLYSSEARAKRIKRASLTRWGRARNKIEYRILQYMRKK